MSLLIALIGIIIVAIAIVVQLFKKQEFYDAISYLIGVLGFLILLMGIIII